MLLVLITVKNFTKEKTFQEEDFFSSVIELVWQANLIQTQKSQRHLFCPQGSRN